MRRDNVVVQSKQRHLSHWKHQLVRSLPPRATGVVSNASVSLVKIGPVTLKNILETGNWARLGRNMTIVVHSALAFRNGLEYHDSRYKLLPELKFANCSSVQAAADTGSREAKVGLHHPYLV